MEKHRSTIYTPLFAIIITVLDANNLSLLIEKLIAALYSTEGTRFASIIRDDMPLSTVKAIQQVAQNANITWNSPTTVKAFLSTIQQILTEAPVLHVTLSSEPTQDLLETMSTWARQELDSHSLLAISLDPGILGGICLSYNGHFLDLSVRSELDSYFTTQKQAIIHYLTGK